MPRRLLYVVVLLVVCLFATSPTSQTAPIALYSIRDLGSLGGSLTSALATGPGTIGGSGEAFAAIAGYSRTQANANHAFVYERGQMRDLGTLGGATSVARALNGEAAIVGESRNRSGVNHAFLYANGTMQDLGALYGGSGGHSFARGINAYNEIVGGSQTTADPDSIRAFIHRNGVMSLLLEQTYSGRRSVANDINGPAQVAGSVYDAGGTSHKAFLHSGGFTTVLGTLGGANSESTALNQHGHVAGWSQTAGSSYRHAFMYRDRRMQDLGTLGGRNSEALGINDSGEVVGTSQIAGSSTYHAFIWRNGRMIDLNTLLPPGSGWVLERASDINNGGQIVGRGSFGGQTRAFVLLPPVDVNLANFGFNDDTGNYPIPVQAGRTLHWVYFVTNQSDGGRSATNVTFTDTLSGNVEYVSIVEDSGGDCRILNRTLECTFAVIEDGSPGMYVRVNVRATAAGVFGHTARITHADQADPDPTDNGFSEQNRAISLQALALKPSTVAGGKPVGVNVTLTEPHPNGASVRLTSSNPSVFPVPATFVVPFDQTRAFNVIPAVVSTPTTVDVTATYGLVTKTATLTVLPPALSALQLTPTTAIGGCGTVAARVTLTGSAPAAGAAVAINESIAAAQFPTALVMPAGQIIRTFSIPTSWVTTPQSALVTASYGGASRSVTLTVRPVRAQALTLTPNPVRGGGTASGVVRLECASPTPVIVALSSGNGAVAAPTVATVTVPAGQLSAPPFGVRTTAVTAPTSVPIYARVYGVRRTAMLTVNP